MNKVLNEGVIEHEKERCGKRRWGERGRGERERVRDREREREMGQGNAAAEDRTYVSNHENGFW
jgi:hypothetical protein